MPDLLTAVAAMQGATSPKEVDAEEERIAANMEASTAQDDGSCAAVAAAGGCSTAAAAASPSEAVQANQHLEGVEGGVSSCRELAWPRRRGCS